MLPPRADRHTAILETISVCVGGGEAQVEWMVHSESSSPPPSFPFCRLTPQVSAASWQIKDRVTDRERQRGGNGFQLISLSLFGVGVG